MEFKRITIEPDKMGGVPCIRGLRFPAATVVHMLADGMSRAEILHAHPDLEDADISEALRYAAEAMTSLEKLEDAVDVDEAVRVLENRSEKPVAWEQVKREMGLNEGAGKASA